MFDVKESDGFYICCDVSHFDECDANNAWEAVNCERMDLSRQWFSSEFILQRVLDVKQDSENSLLVYFDSCGVGLAYLWNETPVLGTEALPLYSTNNFKLPAAPWKVPVKIGK